MGRRRIPAGIEGRELSLLWQELAELRALVGRGVTVSPGAPVTGAVTRIRQAPDNPLRVIVDTDTTQDNPRRLVLPSSTLVAGVVGNPRRAILTETDVDTTQTAFLRTVEGA